MTRIEHWAGLLLMVLLPPAMVVRMIWDLKHPESWDEAWRNDPRIYLPALGIGIPVVGLLALAAVIRDRREQRMGTELDRLMNRAKRLRSLGEHEAADRALDEWEALWPRSRMGKLRPLKPRCPRKTT